MKVRAPMRLPGRKWLWAAGLVVLIFLAYLWAGYVLAPRLIRSEAARWAGRHAGLSLELGPVKVDPLHFTISARDIRLTERRAPLFSLGRLYVAISPLSLIEPGYRITELYLGHPAVHMAVSRAGKANFTALFASSGHSSGPAPVFRIDDLIIDRGELSFTDLGRSPAIHTRLRPISFRLTDFRTRGRSRGRFVLQADADGAHLAWQGRVSMSPLASRGVLSLSGLEARGIAQFLPPDLAVKPVAGLISLSAQYNVAHGARGVDTRVSALDVTATGLDLRDARVHGRLHIARIEAHSGTLRMAVGTPATGSLPTLTLRGARLSTRFAGGGTLRLARLSLQGARFNEGRHRLDVSSLALAGLRLPVRRARRGRISLLRLLPGSSTRAAAPLPKPSRSRSASWRIRLGRLALTDAVVPVRDLAVSPAARFQVTLHSFTAQSLSNNLKRAVPFRLRASIGRGYLALNGRLTPASLSAALWISLAHLSLKPFAPYLPLASSVKLHSGQLGTRAFAELASGKLIRFHGRASVGHLRLLDRANGAGLFGWRDLSLTGIQYRANGLVVKRARLSSPVGDITILPNHSLNVTALLPAHSHAGAAARPAHRPRSTARAFSAVLRRFDIEDGAIVFADESVEPHFRAPVDDLHGSFTDLSTARNSIATIRLSGQVIDRFSPVSISGKLNPYGLGRDTDIHVAFNDIQLPIFNPYSDFYAGYAIARGTLSTRFHYRIVDRRLLAEHHIIIDQLQWGGPSGSKHRVGWPIRLATALLKDRSGVIRINLPVTGSLDNPDFHIASIVWTMLAHLLEKAALAPFDLIGKLFAGARQAQYIDFTPGSSVLPAGAAGSLKALAHALSQRPALKLDIPAGPAGAADAVAIEDARIDALLAARARSHRSGAARPPSLRERVQALVALYRTRLKKPPAYPPHLPLKPVASPAGAPSAQQTRRRLERARIHWLLGRLRLTVRPSAGTLTALGLARANRVRDALLAGAGLPAKRVFITTAESGVPWHGRIRLKLRLR